MPYRSRDDLLSHAIDEDQVEELLSLRKQGWTMQALADKFHIHKNTVSNIIKRAKKRDGDAKS